MNKQVLRDFITTRPALQELLKEALHIEGTTRISHSKNIPKGKEHHHNEEFTSTNGQNSQPALNGSIKLIYIIVNPKCKWTKCPNQKTQTGKMDKKPKPIGMLHPDPSHMQGYTKTQNKVMEEDLPTKWRAKKKKKSRSCNPSL